MSSGSGRRGAEPGAVIAQRLRQAYVELADEAERRQTSLAAARAEGEALRGRLKAASLREALAHEYAEEDTLRRRLSQAEAQSQLLTRFSGSLGELPASLSGVVRFAGTSDSASARARFEAQELRIEATALERLRSEAQASAGARQSVPPAQAQASAGANNSGPDMQFVSEMEGRATVVRRALNDLERLRAALAARCEDLDQLEAAGARLRMQSIIAEDLRAQLLEVKQQEQQAEEAELRLLARARVSDQRLQLLRAEAQATERRSAELATLMR